MGRSRQRGQEEAGDGSSDGLSEKEWNPYCGGEGISADECSQELPEVASHSGCLHSGSGGCCRGSGNNSHNDGAGCSHFSGGESCCHCIVTIGSGGGVGLFPNSGSSPISGSCGDLSERVVFAGVNRLGASASAADLRQARLSPDKLAVSETSASADDIDKRSSFTSSPVSPGTGKRLSTRKSDSRKRESSHAKIASPPSARCPSEPWPRKREPLDCSQFFDEPPEKDNAKKFLKALKRIGEPEELRKKHHENVRNMENWNDSINTNVPSAAAVELRVGDEYTLENGRVGRVGFHEDRERESVGTEGPRDPSRRRVLSDSRPYDREHAELDPRRQLEGSQAGVQDRTRRRTRLSESDTWEDNVFEDRQFVDHPSRNKIHSNMGCGGLEFHEPRRAKKTGKERVHFLDPSSPAAATKDISVPPLQDLSCQRNRREEKYLPGYKELPQTLEEELKLLLSPAPKPKFDDAASEIHV